MDAEEVNGARLRLVALLRHQLFVYRDLWRFLDEPFEGPLPLRDDYIPPPPKTPLCAERLSG